MSILTTVLGRGATAAKNASTPKAGRLWFDTDLGKLQRYNGAGWDDCAESTSVTFNDAEGDPADVSRTAAADGASTYPARRDHAHKVFAFSGCQLTKSATQNATKSAWTKVTFDGEVFDTDTYHDNVTNNTRLTVPATGYYLVGCAIRLLSNADNVPVIIYLTVNNAFVNGHGLTQLASGGAAVDLSLSHTVVMSLSAGAYVEAELYHANSVDKNIDTSPNGTAFWIVRLA